MAKYSVFSAIAKQIGTRCGRPSGPMVARWAIRASETWRSMVAWSTLGVMLRRGEDSGLHRGGGESRTAQGAADRGPDRRAFDATSGVGGPGPDRRVRLQAPQRRQL